MEWEKLLLPVRNSRKEKPQHKNDKRNPFERDFSRMSLSYHVRRLQNKAQVFPLEEDDFVRTRLTHSIEVSCFAKNVGASIEKIMIDNKQLDSKLEGRIPNILSTAGLIHDLGNPPFGHAGEEAIRCFFSSNYNFDKDFPNEEKNDFLNFEGNPQTLRIISKLGINDYDLTLPTIATTIKYPCNSFENNIYYKEPSKHKFGYFQSEKEIYDKINLTLNLDSKRHPLTFILEAIDDITYLVCDIEDGHRKGIIDFYDFFNKVENAIKNNFEKNKEIEDIKKKITKYNKESYINREIIIQGFRSNLQTILLNEIIDVFFNNYNNIIDGNYYGNLLEDSKYNSLCETLKTLGKEKIYFCNEVLKREIAGKKVITFLLNEFINNKSGKTDKLIGPLHKYIIDKQNYTNSNYKDLQLIVDYISGMTDNYILKLYQELNGLKI